MQLVYIILTVIRKDFLNKYLVRKVINKKWSLITLRDLNEQIIKINWWTINSFNLIIRYDLKLTISINWFGKQIRVG